SALGREECVGPAQMKPGFLRDVAFGDRHEAGYACFGGEQVVTGGVGPASRQIVTDGKDLLAPVIKKTEIHFLYETVASLGDTSQLRRQILSGAALDQGFRGERQ